MILLIEKALIDRNLKLKVLDFELKENERMALIGNSATFKNIKQNLNKIAPTNSRVLITGPSGSGKELIARWIHKKSKGRHFLLLLLHVLLYLQKEWSKFYLAGMNNN